MNTKNQSFINALGTAVPAHRYGQSDLLAFMLERIPMPPEKQAKLSHLYTHSGIDYRHSVLPDFGRQSDNDLFASPEEASLSARMQVYQQEVLPLSLQAIQRCLESQTAYRREAITHLIAVSCTGLSAPGLDLMLLKALDLPSHTQRTCVHYMGCYAALHALKQADAICRADPEAVVLVVCAELCTLHFQQEASLDSLASCMLFADGAAAALISGRPLQPQSLAIEGFYSEVMLEGWNDMTWNLSETGFLMRLGPAVPQLLRQGMTELVRRAQEHLHWETTPPQAWALHPGGRKILDFCAEALELPTGALQASRQVLREYGNMSSPTVLFVLAEMLQQPLPEQARIFTAAFGPGLTMESAGLSLTPNPR